MERNYSFDAFDSELQEYEWTIPEGYSAQIEDRKIIIKKDKSKFEKMKDLSIHFLENCRSHYACVDEIDKCIEWIKNLKENN